MAKKIGVIAIKGGVGKTTTVSNLGAILSKDFNKKVLLVDANFSAPNLALHLGIVEPHATIHDVLNDKISIKNIIQKHEAGFDFIPGSLIKQKINPLKLKSKIKEIDNDYDIILFDSSPSLNEEILSTIIASDSLLVVTTPDYPTLSCTLHAVKVAKKRNTPIMGLILNKIYKKKFELSTKDIEDATETPVIALLPHDIKFLESLSKTKPTALHSPSSGAVIEYKKLAAALIGEEYKDRRLSTRIKNFFINDIPKHEINRTILRGGNSD